MYLYIIAGLAVLASFLANRKKTLSALKIAAKRFVKILPAFLTMIILVSIVLFLIPDEVISKYLGGSNKFIGVIFASLFGSITLMPGFIAFPLAGILLKEGVAYIVLAAFTTTLMMVGVLTAPIEKAYFGMKVTVIRNVIGLFIALFVTLAIGVAFGEIF
ncbi:MAG TPA: permease [Dehalococcoidales bacterium]|nr:permease [Dehalococcoidales bacterium]